MQVRVRRIPDDQLDQLEEKIQEILNQPNAAGYEVAAAVHIAGAGVIVIFQKP